MLTHALASKAALRFAALSCLIFVTAVAGYAQSGRAIYDQVKAFSLSAGKAELNAVVFKRDRVEMTLTGTVYFASPVNGRVTGAVFVGRGNFRAEVPSDAFERANVKRLLGSEDAIESDFKTAVMSFSDDSAEVLGQAKVEGTAPADVQQMATDVQKRMLKEAGANIASRVALSLINHEARGFFFAHFDGGKRERFSYIFDYQTRIPTDYFGINAGEKGIIFKYSNYTRENDVWLAFYSLADYARNAAPYSSDNDIIDIEHYDMNIDLSKPNKHLGLKTEMRLMPRFNRVRAIPFNIGESLGETEDARLKKQMRLRSARANGANVEFVQEDWESGFTVFLADSANTGEPLLLDLDIDGDFLRQPDVYRGDVDLQLQDCSYPRSNESWYPRHGYLDRSTFKLVYKHAKGHKVASGGTRKSEGPSGDKDTLVTTYEMNQPVALITFALGPFKRYNETIKWETGEPPTPLEFSSIPNQVIAEQFTLAELSNTVRYFQVLFGKYPYETYSATFHPYGFGQGFPTMLMIPPTNTTNKYTLAFIAHETAHQWWGNIVSWRSYRDQWLSEGFAEYSGVLYANVRKDPNAAKKLVEDMREDLNDPPTTLSGRGKGKLFEIGPLILGHRLSSRRALEGYQSLIYSKGGLVLRMVHYLMTDPVSGDGEPFFDMMKDFVERHRNKTASTDDFRKVANEHFARTPLARQFGLRDMDWFFRQWVYEYDMPTYKLEYQTECQPDGSCVVSGNVLQENVPPDWFMALPIVFDFGGNKFAQSAVAARGPKSPFRIKLPMKPAKVELDPKHWILSEKTSSK